MNTVTREHLAGLELALEELALGMDMRKQLEKLIAQASAAPEQETIFQVKDETSNWIDVSAEKYEACLGKPGNWQRRKVYTHADPPEMEQLRAENARLLSAGQALESDFSSYRREVEHKDEACTRRADAAEQKLAEAQALMHGVQPATLNDFRACWESMRDLLSATAQPAEVKS